MSDEVPTLRLGTRGSDLARCQAQLVTDALARLGRAPRIETIVIRTSGDEGGRAAGAIDAIGAFTSELEKGVREGRLDVAVHSLKDLPVESPSDVALGAILEREDPADALVDCKGRHLSDLPAGARIGTASLRRRALILSRRPDLRVIDVRGNVPTRLGHVDDGRVDAIVLALAGLKRLGLQARVSEVFPAESWPPAAGQAAIAVQARAGDRDVMSLLRAIDHGPTRLTTTAERAFMGGLPAGCRAPIAAFARLEETQRMVLTGLVASLDGRTMLTERISGPVSDEAAACALGERLAAMLAAVGAEHVLMAARSDVHESAP